MLINMIVPLSILLWEL